MYIRIKEICKEKGYTQKEIAEKLNISEMTISRAVKGNTSLDLLNKLSVALGVSISELFEQPKVDFLNCPHCGGKIKFDKGE
jgi:transcriptional regulator with XRE-family HTH domain